MNSMKLTSYGKTHNLWVEINHYAYGGGLAIELYDRTDGDLEPYSNLTVNIDARLSGPDCAFVDTNNFPSAKKLIRKYRLGRPTGVKGYSGRCKYPEYRFKMKKLEKYVWKEEK